ncbi:hypothetical protein PPL_04139 [Heterostelium album PN500]|uniref:C2H2-type domain-containing protein n=1 Tax=Heterostelium pallidum (strain ATCC 26659 / Pp 5 / PN500) TaxID=670386 RepID=D3B648_HETP5|nr:hypothetical protein PPL_04139 [Heterostelium album PN500]EFA83346.1 hypothetical protein PPL_04139 [Heterostelium album PN500]|eukprot:XP_020435463.1 hypothetical protein PPL_04139 [Heterostelium album PN500]
MTSPNNLFGNELQYPINLSGISPITSDVVESTFLDPFLFQNIQQEELNDSLRDSNSNLNFYQYQIDPNFYLSNNILQEYLDKTVEDPAWKDIDNFKLIEYVYQKMNISSTVKWEEVATVLDKPSNDCMLRYQKLMCIFETFLNQMDVHLSENKDDLSFEYDSSGHKGKKRIRRTASEIDRPYKCDMCPKAYGTDGALKMHAKIKHPAENSNIICSSGSSSSSISSNINSNSSNSSGSFTN